MKRFSEQFYTKAQSVKLQAVEREELRNRVLSYMEYHPLEGVTKNSKKLAVDQPRYIQLPISMMMRWSGAVAAIMLVVVPVLAEQTVPGDKLYAVKVDFTEEVISTLKLSPYQKVEWETERLNRRIAEARLLANEGKLTEEVEAEIVAAVQQHTESAEASIEDLRADDADQAVLASLELNTTLQMQSDALEGDGVATMALAMAKAAPTEEGATQTLADAINASISKQESGATTAVPPYEKIMARVEINTTRAHELLKSYSGEDKVYKDATRRLEDINRTIEKASGMRGQDETLASESLLDVLQRTKKIIVFLSDTSVNGVTDIETVVPIVYTDDELKGQLVTLNEEVNRKIEIISILNPQVSVGASEKALYAIGVAKNNQAIISSSTEPVSAVYTAKESIAVLDDMLRIFEAEGVGVNSVPTPVVEETASTSPEAPVVEEVPPTN
jgi:hypothetical protein